MLREFAGAQVLGQLTGRIERPDPELRAALVGMQLIGLVVMRYVVALPPLAGLSADGVVAALAPAVQRYLTGDLTTAELDSARG